MAKRSRRSFTPEFKAEAVRLVETSGKSINAVAGELGLPRTALANWVTAAAERPAGNGKLSSSEREELERLRREVKNLRMERDFLKKTAAFFAKESQ
jgi:transposase-like protein